MAELPFSLAKTNQSRPAQPHEGLGILLFLGVIFTIIAIVLYGGIFFYKNLLNGQIQTLSDSLKKIQADFDPPLIQELSRISKKIDAAKILLGQHRSISRIFQFLEDNTLDTAAFSNFTFSDKDNSVTNCAEILKTLQGFFKVSFVSYQKLGIIPEWLRPKKSYD